jgi:hypothetical protein
MPKLIDLTGQRFGYLVVVEYAGTRGYDRGFWLCQCDCGNTNYVTTSHLKSGHTKSCGCLNKAKISERSYKNIVGERFNRLIVIKDVGRVKRNVLWLCKCDCGGEITVTGNRLRSGNTKSCGCYARDYNSERTRIDITGNIFGRLTAIKEVGRNKHGSVLWLCECSCGSGKEVIAPTGALRYGQVRSCGCLIGDTNRERSGENSPNWNPDRKTVELNRTIHRISTDLVRDVLRCMGRKKTSKSEDLLGYTRKELKEHLEKQFTPEMNWQNHGGVWHVDHIIPVIYFVRNGITDLKVINALSNLRPLDKFENLSKGAKYNELEG